MGIIWLRRPSFGQSPGNGSASIHVAGGPLHAPGLTLTAEASIVLSVREEFTSTETNSNGPMGGRRSFAGQGPRSYLNANLESAEEYKQPQTDVFRAPTEPNDDSLMLENVLPGRYYLRLYSSRGYVSAASMGGVDVLNRAFEVGSGSTTPIEITMRDDWAKLEGKVNGTQTGANQNSQFQGVWVYCIPAPDSSGVFQQLSVMADGSFDLGHDRSGRLSRDCFQETAESSLPRWRTRCRLMRQRGNSFTYPPGRTPACNCNCNRASET